MTLGNLDVLGLVPLGVFGLLVDLLLGDRLRFSARSPRRTWMSPLRFVDDVFVNQQFQLTGSATM